MYISDMNTANQIIDALGGTKRVAELCGLTPSAISQWRTNGIPKAWDMFLRKAKPGTFRKLAEQAA